MTIQQLQNIPSVAQNRLETHIRAFDQMMGGGFVDGQSILLAGQPGAGKSTLLLQLSTIFSNLSQTVLYVCGEESLVQVKLRADRLGTLGDRVFCSDGVKLEEILETVKKIQPKFLIVDSLQTMSSDELKQEPGSPKQTKHCLKALNKFCKEKGIILLLIGHSTKTGMIAGLLTLQHEVDTVIFLTKDNGKNRWLAVNKNRFGDVDKVFAMQMEEGGFSQFKWQISKGKQVHMKDVSKEHLLLRAQKTFGNEARLSKADLESVIHNGGIRMLYHILFHFFEKALFGDIIDQDFELVYKLKPTVDIADKI